MLSSEFALGTILCLTSLGTCFGMDRRLTTNKFQSAPRERSPRGCGARVNRPT